MGGGGMVAAVAPAGCGISCVAPSGSLTMSGRSGSGLSVMGTLWARASSSPSEEWLSNEVSVRACAAPGASAGAALMSFGVRRACLRTASSNASPKEESGGCGRRFDSIRFRPVYRNVASSLDREDDAAGRAWGGVGGRLTAQQRSAAQAQEAWSAQRAHAAAAAALPSSRSAKGRWTQRRKNRGTGNIRKRRRTETRKRATHVAAAKLGPIRKLRLAHTLHAIQQGECCELKAFVTSGYTMANVRGMMWIELL